MSGPDFTKLIKDVLAKRAGFQCSNPDCEARTIGPSDSDPRKSVNLGEAAHVHGARLGVARYNPTMSEEQRSDVSNGLWLCAMCAHKIDVNNGIDHPPELLREWKRKREEAVAKELGQRPRLAAYELAGIHSASGIGTITGADLQAPTRIAPGTQVSASGIGRITAVKIGGGNE